jgi:pimeloyl-ACP methyl ester carboxylesterase
LKQSNRKQATGKEEVFPPVGSRATLTPYSFPQIRDKTPIAISGFLRFLGNGVKLIDMTIQPARQTCTGGSISFSYLTWGEGDPLLLLHGLADHGLVWQGLAQALGEHYRCVAPDLRGHGLSDKPIDPNAYGSPALVQDLEALANNFGWTQVRVVAHSWAAKLALLWAKQHPDLIQQLVLVDPFFVNRLPELFRPTFPVLYRTLPFLKVMGPFDTYDQAETLAKALKQYRGWSPLQEQVFRAGMEEKSDGRWGSKFAIAARNGVFADILQLAGLTETVETPTLLLLPEKGLNRLDWQIKPYKTYLPNLQIQRIPGNHWPHLVAPNEFNRAVDAFLSNAAVPGKVEARE